MSSVHILKQPFPPWTFGRTTTSNQLGQYCSMDISLSLSFQIYIYIYKRACVWSCVLEIFQVCVELFLWRKKHLDHDQNVSDGFLLGLIIGLVCYFQHWSVFGTFCFSHRGAPIQPPQHGLPPRSIRPCYHFQGHYLALWGHHNGQTRKLQGVLVWKLLGSNG